MCSLLSDGLIRTHEQVWRDRGRTAGKQARGRGQDIVSMCTPACQILGKQGGLLRRCPTPLHPVPWLECADGIKPLRDHSTGTENYMKPIPTPASHPVFPSLPRLSVWWLRKCLLFPCKVMYHQETKEWCPIVHRAAGPHSLDPTIWSLW